MFVCSVLVLIWWLNLVSGVMSLCLCLIVFLSDDSRLIFVLCDSELDSGWWWCVLEKCWISVWVFVLRNSMCMLCLWDSLWIRLGILLSDVFECVLIVIVSWCWLFWVR